MCSIARCTSRIGFRMLLLRLLLLSSFGACSRFKGLWGQRLREALARRDPGPLWSRGAPQRLYCPVGIGFHLQIPSEGGVRGVHIPDESCWLRVFSVRPGVVGIQGEKSKLFLCMTEGGRVYTAEQFSDECHLRETMEENHYNTYSSTLHRKVYLGLSRRGRVKRGTSVNPRLPCAHFLPRRQP